jgi:SAM-dependent methyltransferase
MSDVISVTDIHSSVREFYAARATNNDTCCSPTAGKATADCCSPNPFHAEDLLNGIPDDIATFTLGCGDAVSLAHLQPGETVLDLGSGGGLECFIASKQVGAGGRVIGVDMTPEMLSKAWANVATLKAQNVDFR